MAIARLSKAMAISMRIIQEIEHTPKEGALAAVRAFVAGIRSALDGD
jgi:tryptophan synthase alpha chain